MATVSPPAPAPDLAPAPGPDIGVSPPPVPVFPPPPPAACDGSTFGGNLTCQPDYTNYSDSRIVTAIWIFAVVGVVCLLVFGLFRNRISIYKTRLLLPNVWVKPPKLPEGGWTQAWSWLYPVFATSDAEIVHTAGLDSLMVIWTCTLGMQLFLPLMVLGLIILLPVNFTGNRSDDNDHGQNVSGFTRATVSNLAKGSALYWVPFVYVYIVILYACWLLIKYYQGYTVLRQHYLTGGESLINEWHEQYVEQKALEERQLQEAADGGKGKPRKPHRGLRQNLRRLFDPSNPMDTIAEDLDDAASMRSSRRGPIGATMGRIATMQRSATFARSQEDQGHFYGLRQRSSRSFTSPPVTSRTSSRSARHLDRPSQREEVARHAPDLAKKSGSPLRNAGAANGHDSSPEASPPRSRSPSPQRHVQIADDSPQPTPRDRAMHVPHQQPNMERPSAASSASQASSALDGFHQALPSEAVSRYETAKHVKEDLGRERVAKWWRGRKQLDDTGQERTLLGKPNVAWRKVINTFDENGDRVGVNAQQYAVLVMDVPNLAHQRATVIRRAARRRWWWKLWFRFTIVFKRHVLLRKHVMDASVLKKTPRNTADTAAAAKSRDLDAAEGGCAPVPPLDTSALHPNPSKPQADPPVTPPEAETLDAAHPTGTLPANPDETHPEKALDSSKPKLHARPPAHPVKADEQHGKPAPFTLQNGGHRGREEDTIGAVARQLHAADGHANGHAPASPFEEASQQDVHDGVESEAGFLEEPEVTSQELVRNTFQHLFPDSYRDILPVHNHRSIDELLFKWNKASRQLENAEAGFERSGRKQRPKCRVKSCCCCCGGEMADAIDHWAHTVRDLELQIVAERKKVLEGPPTNSYFVFFSSQKDAAIAAQTNLHPEDGHSFRVYEAPGPEEVNWTALWLTWRQRDVREIVVLIPIIIVLLIPVGLFSGAVAQATVAICSNVDGKFYSAWYCSQNSTARAIVTAVLPSLLVTLWQTVVMPMLLYRCALCEGKWPSLSMMDHRIATLFFLWDVLNVFVGAMLGGSIFSQLDNVINDPGSIPRLIGTALPASSNFFINYLVLQSFAMIPFRQMFQHVGILPALFRLCGMCKPKSEHARIAALAPHSVRYGREIGTIMLVFVITLAYAASSPLIVPFAFCYMLASWVYWRYNILYISERCYESGGRVWDAVFTNVMWCLFILEFFTGCIFLANAAYAQASIIWATTTPFLYKFHQYCRIRYGMAVKHVPLELAANAPQAHVDPRTYMAPALRPHASGWHPETGKAWECWGMPTYSF